MPLQRTIARTMTQAFRIVLLGFSDFERRTLASYFRLATHRVPCYQHVQQLADADFVVADADHGPSVQLVVATERMAHTVFIGLRPPSGCTAWMSRPIDPLHVLRELDAMVSLQQQDRGPSAPGDAVPVREPGPGQITVIQPQRRSAGTAPSMPVMAPPVGGGLTMPAVFAVNADFSSTEPGVLQMPMPEPVDAITPQQHRPAPPLTEMPPGVAFDASPLMQPAGPAQAPSHTAAPVNAAVPVAEDASALPHSVAPAEPPGARPAASMAIVAPHPSLPSTAPASGSALRARALLVDDSEIALRFLESRLLAWDLQIDRAGSSGRALQLLASHAYDLVFLDVELGDDSEMDGLALCQHIKRGPGLATAPGSSVIMVSAHHSQLDRVRGTLAGCDAYLGKPLMDEELQQVLKRQGLRAVAPSGTAPPAG